MTQKNFTIFFRNSPRKKTAGFTLIELLVTVAIGWIVISGLIYFVVQLLRTDRQEFARTETERDMSIALNYMASELKEAIYVYEGECLSTSRSSKGKPDYCPGLKSNIGLNDAKVTPILAFWKLDQLPYSDDESLPTCGDADKDCQAILISRNSYTLVVYSLDTTENSTWEGPARIVRYELRQFSKLPSLDETAGYCDPTGRFTSWPQDNKTGDPCDNYTKPTYADQVLVDLVDKERPANVICPSNYSTSPPSSVKSGFLACVRSPIDTEGKTQLQDVIVYIRGNAVKRAGVSFYNNTSFFPTVQAQIQTRSALDRIPRPL